VKKLLKSYERKMSKNSIKTKKIKHARTNTKEKQYLLQTAVLMSREPLVNKEAHKIYTKSIYIQEDQGP
jgi:hypothetical protein